VKPSGQSTFNKPTSITFKGKALRSDAGMWVIGRGFPGGFPNSLQVLDGGIDEVKISGETLPRVAGQNPLFTDAFTADPAITVIGNTVYAYVGQDKASVGGWFNMPNWLCYSTTDMKNWTAHGPVLAANDFANANSGSAWAGQVVEKDGKYYYYVTLDRKEGHFITVAVGDSPTGPFKEARPGKPLITDDMTKDSHRPNADIDPTILIDDDGTPWMAWGNGDCYMVKLNRNMVELDGPITKVPFRNYSEGPWLFKRDNLYYNVYAADAPGEQAEQICYSTAKKITGPWTYGGFITGPAKHGFTIHPSVVEFKKQWYFFYHDGSYTLDGTPGGDCRRQVCVEYLYFNPDGSIKPITLTTEGVSVPAKK
jgi:beta-xylosidase